MEQRIAEPYHPPPAMILGMRPAIRQTVIACGVPATEVDDVTSTCLLAAWTAIVRGAFYLYEGADPAMTLCRWVEGIAWRQSNHERERAHHRREVLAGDPWSLVTEQPVLDIEGQIAARDALRLVTLLPPDLLELLIAVESWEGVALWAAQRGVTASAARLRMKQIRRELRDQIDK